MQQLIKNSIREVKAFVHSKSIFGYGNIYNSIISPMKVMMTEKSQETINHAERLVELSKRLGLVLELRDKDIQELELFATLHDIGKIGIEDKILKKEGQFTQSEWVEMKKHPEIGYRITEASPKLKHVSQYILTHHERWDGKGYPQGLLGESIPLLSRILAVVDAYDAMTEDRVYRKAMTKEAAIQEILINSGSQFDPHISMVFIYKVLNSSDT